MSVGRASLNNSPDNGLCWHLVRLTLVLLLTIAMTCLLSMAEDEGPQGRSEQTVLWQDHYSFNGSCTSRPSRIYFHVNETALAFTVFIEFDDDDPRADVVLYGPDSFVVEAHYITTRTYFIEFNEIEERGLWSVSAGLQTCGIDKTFDFSGTLNVSNRFLERPELVTTAPRAGEQTWISMDGLQLGEGESYRLDLGNGVQTPWRTWDAGETNEKVQYDEPGIYHARAMVRTSDGNTTGWSDPVVIDVAEESGEGTDLADIGLLGAIVLVILIIVMVLVWLMVRNLQ